MCNTSISGLGNNIKFDEIKINKQSEKTNTDQTNKQNKTPSQELINDSKDIKNINSASIEPNKMEFNSIHHYSCILDAIKMATGKEPKNVSSGERLSKQMLEKVTDDKWDELTLSKYTNGDSLSGTIKYISEGKNEDGTHIAKKGTIISDGAHNYVLKDFEYKKDQDGNIEKTKEGKPIVSGIIVTDPASNKERIISAKDIKSGKNVTAFVTGSGDGKASGRADGRMAHKFDDMKSSAINPIDGSANSESRQIRMFFAALGDPRQKNKVMDVMKSLNTTDSKDTESIAKLKNKINEKFNINISDKELSGIVDIFKTDINQFKGFDKGTDKLLDDVKKTKEGEGSFKGKAKSYFTGASSPKENISIGDMFLYLQSEKSFRELDSTSLDPNKEYIDSKKGEIYRTNDLGEPVPLDTIGRSEHNNYQMGIQYVQLSFENFGSSAGEVEDKAKSLLMNFNNLIHGAEGC